MLPFEEGLGSLEARSLRAVRPLLCWIRLPGVSSPVLLKAQSCLAFDGQCYGLNVWVPLKFLCRILIPSVMVLRSGASGK